MAASVQVLCPNGRRQNVKVTPNTKLLQILEEVCQRQGFIPPEDYKLLQGQARKELDLSLSVRFSSLPNNAKLELTRSTSARVEQDVTIALQLDSGQRLQDSFKSSTSLWEILLHLESKNSEYKGVLTRVDKSQTPALYPVCIYMREEVIGEHALAAMTLKKLGMTSGKAIIRLLHRPVDDGVLADILDKLEKEKQKQAKLEEIAQKKSEMRQMDERERSRGSDHISMEDVKEESVTEQMETDETHVTSEMTSQVTSQAATPNVTSNESVPSQSMEEGGDDSVSSSTATSDSTGSKARSSRTSSKKSAPTSDNQPSQVQRPTSSSAIEDLRNLNIPGVEIITPDDFNDLTPQEQMIARRLAARFFPALQPGGVPDPNAVTAAPQQEQEQEPAMPFTDFRFPEATRGMDLTGSNQRETSEEERQPCERQPLVFNADEPLQASSPESKDVPDDFFEVTQADVRVMYRDLKTAVQQLEDQPLLTKAARQAQAEAMFDRYERVIIRFQFPDRLTLQALFRPREPVSALYSFVREHLTDSQLKFYLYTAPPKEILKDMDSSLALNHLAPAALVYFGSDNHQDHYLRDEDRVKVKGRMEAEAQVTRVLQPPLDSSAGSTRQASGNAASTSQAESSGTARRTTTSSGASFSASPSTRVSSSGPVPKWLKFGKK